MERKDAIEVKRIVWRVKKASATEWCGIRKEVGNIYEMLMCIMMTMNHCN